MIQSDKADPLPVLEHRQWVVSEVLFDMDGTLVDSIEAVEAAWNTLAAEEGLVIDVRRGYHGRTARDIVAAAFPPEWRERAFARLEQLESAPGQHVRRLPGVDRLLSSIPRENWSIVTSATRPVALARIGASRIPAPTLLITADDVSNGKPDPEPFRRAQRRATKQIPALAVEDTRAGLIAARQAGCLTIGVLGTEDLEQLLMSADAVVRSLTDVVVAVRDDGFLTIDATVIVSRQNGSSSGRYGAPHVRSASADGANAPGSLQ
ncbi:Sugar phosphatase YfbT [Microbacterium azadirachtae]|uniref:Sugar phosphatase YfbT n=1 Tax=Microbacterium azadirachtae TaxID=582680 RepID=A0A0F0KDI6_9MICO|nr:HAD-IA family hydrolase [Microbacterium azadirachtae]KJL18923.1 Sugar phosphatase YfbT [Microbacterium azadirachtae]